MPDTTIFDLPFQPLSCDGCRDPSALPFDFTMAFQPIVDVDTGRPFAYEALVRGVNGESAASILGMVDDTNRYRFDQACRVRAIEQAAELGLSSLSDCRLSINFLPNAVYRAETCIRATMQAAKRAEMDHSRLMFEVTEGEQVRNPAHLMSIFAEYRRQGLITAIDDFGAGYSGLNLLADFQPDLIKLDMALIRDVDQDRVRQAIVRGIVTICAELDVTVIAEGIESAGERDFLADCGIFLMQGFWFAKPAFKALAQVSPEAWAR